MLRLWKGQDNPAGDLYLLKVFGDFNTGALLMSF